MPGKYDFKKRQNSSAHDDKKKKFGKNVLNVPENVEFFKPGERNKIDILPFAISNKMNPAVIQKGFKPGNFDYVLDLYVHQRIGPNNDNFLCLKQNFKKPCPLCERGRELYLSGSQKEGKAMQAKRRVYYNVIDRLDEDDSVKIFESSYEWFEKELARAAEALADEDGALSGEPVDYASPDVGKRILFKMVDSDLKTTKGEIVKKPAFFSFKDRENIEARMKDSLPLDTYMVIPTAAEMTESLEAYLPDDVEEEDIPFESVDKEPSKPVVETKVEKQKDENPCPYGHVFGRDNDEKPECSDCKVWKACAKAQR